MSVGTERFFWCGLCGEVLGPAPAEKTRTTTQSHRRSLRGTQPDRDWMDRDIAPSSPDQAAFHEGFADVIALLSVFSQLELVQELLRRGRTKKTVLCRPT